MTAYFAWSACVLYFYAPAWPFYSFATERGHILRSHIPQTTARTRPIIKRMSFLWSFYDHNSSNLLSKPALTRHSHFFQTVIPRIHTAYLSLVKCLLSYTPRSIIEIGRPWRVLTPKARAFEASCSLYLFKSTTRRKRHPSELFSTYPPFSGKITFYSLTDAGWITFCWKLFAVCFSDSP